MDKFYEKGCITRLNGRPIYACTLREYMGLEERNALIPDALYAITDQNNVLIGEHKVIGRCVDKFRGVKKLPEAHWREYLKNVIPYQPKKNTEQVVLSSRPTIESQVKEAEVVLNKASKEASASLEQVEESGVNALEKAVTEGEKLTSVKPPVKRTSNRKKRVEV